MFSKKNKGKPSKISKDIKKELAHRFNRGKL